MRCAKCKLEAVDGKKRCQKHLDLGNLYSIKYQHKNKAKKRCIICGTPCKGKLCPACKDSKHISHKKWVANAVSKSVCFTCGNPVVKGRRGCQSCMDKRKVAKRKYYVKLVKAKRCIKCTRKLDEFSLLQNKKSCMVCRQGRVE